MRAAGLLVLAFAVDDDELMALVCVNLVVAAVMSRRGSRVVNFALLVLNAFAFNLLQLWSSNIMSNVKSINLFVFVIFI